MSIRVGLLGWPVEHSISPAMHNAAFAALGLRGCYEPLPTPPLRLRYRLAKLLHEGYVGFNVTIPHKQAILTALPGLNRDKAVLSIGAANTIYIGPDDVVHATNTDWAGFLRDLDAQGISPAGKSCVILGTGGSAQAVAYALRMTGAASLTFVSRTPERHGTTIGYEKLKYTSADLIINCTPLGMWPHVDASPWPEDIPFPANAVLYDLIYNPAETAFMRQARRSGAHAIGGLGMLVQQGGLAFEQWTGQPPPLAVMKRAAQKSLKENQGESNAT